MSRIAVLGVVAISMFLIIAFTAVEDLLNSPLFRYWHLFPDQCKECQTIVFGISQLDFDLQSLDYLC